MSYKLLKAGKRAVRGLLVVLLVSTTGSATTAAYAGPLDWLFGDEPKPSAPAASNAWKEDRTEKADGSVIFGMQSVASQAWRLSPSSPKQFQAISGPRPALWLQCEYNKLRQANKKMYAYSYTAVAPVYFGEPKGNGLDSLLKVGRERISYTYGRYFFSNKAIPDAAFQDVTQVSHDSPYGLIETVSAQIGARSGDLENMIKVPENDTAFRNFGRTTGKFIDVGFGDPSALIREIESAVEAGASYMIIELHDLVWQPDPNVIALPRRPEFGVLIYSVPLAGFGDAARAVVEECTN